MMTPYERVMARVQPDGDCLIWQGATAMGYGLLRVDGKLIKVHRIVLEHHEGPSDANALHSCDQPACVNIDHLRYGTQIENGIDSSRRRRSRNSKFNEDQVREIRRRLQTESVRSLAHEFDVHETTIKQIKYRTSYAWVKEESWC